jgi:hypothetical protein
VGRAPALLGLSLFALLVVYYETSTSLWNWGLWGDVAWIACVLIPAVFALALLALPLARSQLLALFLAAAARFDLRVVWTFVGMVVGLGLTIAATTEFAALGLPALPGIALGFLVPNADLIYRRLRTKPASETEPVSHTG